MSEVDIDMPLSIIQREGTGPSGDGVHGEVTVYIGQGDYPHPIFISIPLILYICALSCFATPIVVINLDPHCLWPRPNQDLVLP